MDDGKRSREKAAGQVAQLNTLHILWNARALPPIVTCIKWLARLESRHFSTT